MCALALREKTRPNPWYAPESTLNEKPRALCPDACEQVPSSYAKTASGDKLYGENAIHLPKPDLEIVSPYDAEGVVQDWDTASRLWEYAVTSRLTGHRQTPPARNGLNDGNKDENGDVNIMDEAAEEELADKQEQVLGEYPLLVTEPGWNPAKAREKTIEIAMEQWAVPAFFLAKTGQLAAYSQGKATALVVDMGHHNTSVTALHEGMVLKKSIQRTPLAGNWLSDQIRLMYAQQNVPLVPHYMVKSKLPVDAGAPSNATYVTFDKPPTDSYRRLEEERVLTAFKESVVQAWPGPGRLDQPVGSGGQTNADQVKQLPPKPFEMPDGWNQVFGLERFKVAEGLFDHKAAYSDAAHQLPQQTQTITQTVRQAVESVDVDQRPALLNNVILTGAGSLIEKLPERLQADLSALFPNPKVRVIANSNAVERKYGAWIGGSVLASLGTFHQMWVSKAEYDEFGAKIVEKRCK